MAERRVVKVQRPNTADDEERTYEALATGTFLVRVDEVERTEDFGGSYRVRVRILNGPNKDTPLTFRLFRNNIEQSIAKVGLTPDRVEELQGNIYWGIILNKPRRDGKGYFSYVGEFLEKVSHLGELLDKRDGEQGKGGVQ